MIIDEVIEKYVPRKKKKRLSNETFVNVVHNAF
jgi:hypothetical protein